MSPIRSRSLFLAAAISLGAAPFPSVKPEDAGLSGERLQRIHSIVQRHMDLGDISGAGALPSAPGIHAARIPAGRALGVRRQRWIRRAGPDRRSRLRRTVERVSEEELFDPLDMPESSHYSTDAQMPCLAAYQKTDKGPAKTQNSLSMSSQVYSAGGGGLVSTPTTVHISRRCPLTAASQNSKRLLSQRTVKLMSAVHVPYTLPSRTPGEGFVLSVRVIHERDCGQPPHCGRAAFMARTSGLTQRKRLSPS